MFHLSGAIHVRLQLPAGGLSHLPAGCLSPSCAQILIRNRATDLDARMHDGTTPLILAARLAVEGMLEDLINSHADVNAVDDLGRWEALLQGGGSCCRPPVTFSVCGPQVSRLCTGLPP